LGRSYQESCGGVRRPAFMEERLFFVFRRATLDDLLGRVGILLFSSLLAWIRISRTLSTAISLFRYWDLSSSANRERFVSSLSRSPSFTLMRDFSLIVNPSSLSMSTESRTFVFTLFTFCPPGPPDREKVKTPKVSMEYRTSGMFMHYFLLLRAASQYSIFQLILKTRSPCNNNELIYE